MGLLLRFPFICPLGLSLTFSIGLPFSATAMAAKSDSCDALPSTRQGVNNKQLEVRKNDQEYIQQAIMANKVVGRGSSQDTQDERGIGEIPN